MRKGHRSAQEAHGEDGTCKTVIARFWLWHVTLLLEELSQYRPAQVQGSLAYTPVSYERGTPVPLFIMSEVILLEELSQYRPAQVRNPHTGVIKPL